MLSKINVLMLQFFTILLAVCIYLLYNTIVSSVIIAIAQIHYLIHLQLLAIAYDLLHDNIINYLKFDNINTITLHFVIMLL